MELGCEVKYSKCYMAKRIALKMIFGDASEEYSRVWDYAEAVRRFNPGSAAIVKCIGIEKPPPLFQRMYICLLACKEGFVAGCRPIIGVGGAHLTGKFPGILLSAVEDLRSVTASSSRVQAGGDAFTFMSDRKKGLVEAFSSVIPEAEFRFCCRHIWENFKIKFPGELFKQHFWRAARAYNKKIFVEAYEYLAAIPIKHWSGHAFSSRNKSGMLLINCSETFNNVRYVLQRSAAKREGLSNFEGVLTSSTSKMIEKNAKDIYGLRVIPVDVFEFEVDDDDESYVVNLTNKTCHCGSWKLIGIPCKHAMACIVLRNYMPTNLSTRRIMTQKMPRRPNKRKRKKEADEGKGGKKPACAFREFKQRRCGNCGNIGHYKKGDVLYASNMYILISVVYDYKKTQDLNLLPGFSLVYETLLAKGTPHPHFSGFGFAIEEGEYITN
ncbi:uncharacterized protein LOC130823321 [Amaranthus tricolor]|uniref:uncharacterized protein LOC130823321 n=1 Tax=Amaranthus tricolor TaxID=29722 RepID=UPI00258BA22E|nr:uncharacterized protein LOC130823321 [Amaranthus tricolor]